MKNQANAIKKFLLQTVTKHPNDLVAVTMQQFSVSRTTVLRHITRLIEQGELLKSGSTKQITYALKGAKQLSCCLPINAALDEFKVFDNYFLDALQNFANENTISICEYGITEMVNNAKDHAHGTQVRISMEITDALVNLSIEDNGVGVFERITQTLKYPNYAELMLDLSKGKLTTDPANHTGEGIFFSSRSFDQFSLIANGYRYFTDNLIHDWSFEKAERGQGTRIELSIARHTARNIVDIFKAYQDDETLAFSKTEIKVELAKLHGERLISRSQAKRIVQNLDKFTDVLLDFTHITAVGQGFADEIFRVYQSKHPEINFHYCHANEDVEFMLKRAIATMRLDTKH